MQAALREDAAKPRASHCLTDGNEVSSFSSPQSSRQVSLLAGKLYDETGDRLTPSHANKRGRRYRYYVSNRLIKRSGEAVAILGGWRLPARELEGAVVDVVTGWVKDHRSIANQLLVDNPDIETTQHLIAGLERFRDHLYEARGPIEQLNPFIENVTMSQNQITIKLNRGELLGILGLPTDDTSNDEEDPISISAPFLHRKRGVESKLVLGINSDADPDPVLISNVARARQWLHEIKSGKAITDIALQECRSIKQIQRYLELAFLSPRLIQQIVEGIQLPELTSRYLVKNPIPAAWEEQHQKFGTI